MIKGFVDQGSYMVKSVQVDLKEPTRTERFYVPMVMPDLGFTWEPILDSGELPTHWGFETEDAAWDVCKDHAARQESMANRDDWHNGCPRDRDREDFHSDG